MIYTKWKGTLHGGRLLFFTAAFVVIVVAPTQTEPLASEAVAFDRKTGLWLKRIDLAAQQRSYQGTFVYQRHGAIQSSRIMHYAGRGQEEYEQIENLDGQPRKMLRHNEHVYTFLPGRKICIIGKRQYKKKFPALLSMSSGHVLDFYKARLAGSDRVAGHAAQLIALDPKDAYRFAYKLWADQQTGLLLRAQTLDANGQVLEQIAFSEVRIDVPVDRSAIAASIKETLGWRMVHAPVTPVTIAAEGWHIKQNLLGFHKLCELRLPVQAHHSMALPIQVKQVVFSDGLAVISVFIEAVTNGGSRKTAGEVTRTHGVTHVLVKRCDNFQVSLFGEVPFATLKRFASAIKYRPPQ